MCLGFGVGNLGAYCMYTRTESHGNQVITSQFTCDFDYKDPVRVHIFCDRHAHTHTCRHIPSPPHSSHTYTHKHTYTVTYVTPGRCVFMSSLHAMSSCMPSFMLSFPFSISLSLSLSLSLSRSLSLSLSCSLTCSLSFSFFLSLSLLLSLSFSLSLSVCDCTARVAKAFDTAPYRSMLIGRAYRVGA